MLNKLHKGVAAEYPGFRTLCPTRWTLRRNSLKSILDNWLPLQKLWEESLSRGGLPPELGGRIIDVQPQMETFEYYFGVTIMQKILGHSDNLSRSIQSADLTSTDVIYLAHCTVETLEKIRTDRDFDLLRNDLNEKADSLDLREPKQPRKRKLPQKLLENDTASTTYDEVSDVKTYHRHMYFNALDAVINAVKDQFDRPGYTNYENIEQQLLSAVHGKCTKL